MCKLCTFAFVKQTNASYSPIIILETFEPPALMPGSVCSFYFDIAHAHVLDKCLLYDIKFNSL